MTIEDIDKNLPNGLHDSRLIELHIDYINKECMLTLNIDISNIGDSNNANKPNYSKGMLKFSGLLFYIIEPPHFLYLPNDGLWISDTGLVTIKDVYNKKTSIQVPDDSFIYYLFINNWNAFIYICASNVSFDWLC